MTTRVFISRKAVSRQDHLKKTFNNYSHEETDSELLHKLRERNSKSVTKVTPDLASQVVKEYILPLFEYEKKVKHNRKRSDDFGTSGHRKNLSAVDGTVFSELKLSDQLSKDMSLLSQELINARRALKEKEQEKYTISEELKRLKETHQNAIILIEHLQRENLNLEVEVQNFKSPNLLMYQQLFSFKLIIEKLTEQNNKISQAFHEEKANNDIRLIKN